MTDPNEHLKPPHIQAEDDCSGTPSKSTSLKQSRKNVQASQGHSRRKGTPSHRRISRKESLQPKSQKTNQAGKGREEDQQSSLKAIQPDKQRRITDYFSNVVRPTIHHEIPRKEPLSDPLIIRKKSQLASKQAEIDALQARKVELEENYRRDDVRFAEYRRRTRAIMIQTLSEIYSHKRRSRQRPNPQVGFPRSSLGLDFVEGPRFTCARQTLLDLSRKLKNLHEMLCRTQDDSEKETLQLRASILERQQRQTQHLLKLLEQEKRQLIARMKLSTQEMSCKLAKQNWPVVGDKYLSLQLLGKGGFSEVYRVYDLKENCQKAMKISYVASVSMRSRQEYMRHVTRQYNIQKALFHPNIARLYDVVFLNDDEVVTVLELCNGPELSEYMRKKDRLEEKEAKAIIRQVLSALRYLDSKPEKIIHYDLKPQNIIFHQEVVKVLDFGLCKVVGPNQSKIQLTSQGTGTYWYLPPQTFDQQNPRISNKVDIWSVGTIYYEMLFGRKPFGHGMSQTRIYAEGIMMGATRVEFPQAVAITDGAKSFIKGCLEYDQDRRLSVLEAYNHAYFNQK